MTALIVRVYQEHYKADLPRRIPLLEASADAHGKDVNLDPAELGKRLSGRDNACIGDVCPGPFEKLYFSPSLDVGPYISCSNLGSIHGYVYPCDANGDDDTESEADTVRLARIYKALADEQRLSILQMLRGREMYVQEIVDRTGLHQSVVSRHLSFMAAVGLLVKRRKGSMKYLSINPEMHETLAGTIDLFAAAAQEPASTREG
jgi:DNA-binding transcriptional ArsR family regulator